MTAHTDILDERESLKRPLLFSVVMHGTIVLALVFGGIASGRPRDLWGSPNSTGGSSVGITPVSQIPLPARGGPVNPLANDSESSAPEPPPAKQETQRKPVPDAAAIAIKSKAQPKKKTSRLDTSTKRSKLITPPSLDQVYSTTGSALRSPLVGQTGSGGAKMGSGGAFGNRFGAYRDLLEQAVGRRWRTNDVDPRLRTAPPAIVTFTLRRNGSISDVRLENSSGNRALDDSAQRAILEAAPFPPLPPEYERNDARVEFQFYLQR